MTKIKICGITRKQDFIAAMDLGVDAVGLVFTQRSPRAVTVEQARTILTHINPFISIVALFMDNSKLEVEAIIQSLPVSVLQFHGSETPEFCAQFGFPYLKSLPMGDGADLSNYANRYSDASGFLADSNKTGEVGGSGKVFDWNRFPQNLCRPVIVAGGLSVENVGDAVRELKPYGVDVSSGVEADKGIKDYEKMRMFINEVRSADREQNRF